MMLVVTMSGNQMKILYSKSNFSVEGNESWQRHSIPSDAPTRTMTAPATQESDPDSTQVSDSDSPPASTNFAFVRSDGRDFVPNIPDFDPPTPGPCQNYRLPEE
ncbi:hypothetical protein Hamer_G002344 [Homarus americanus]|uniref:Uncharacterized protein n=1 Tax=Homarus americanus TaxID=6706 RepID=A0A8J5MYS4_HOMAM|nr:hypothetical protein Hamer_G002344 [Homarus americanus]